MSIERAKADLRKRLSEVKAEAIQLEKALLALGVAAAPVLKHESKKAFRKGVKAVKRWSAAANKKRSEALKKFHAARKVKIGKKR